MAICAQISRTGNYFYRFTSEDLVTLPLYGHWLSRSFVRREMMLRISRSLQLVPRTCTHRTHTIPTITPKHCVRKLTTMADDRGLEVLFRLGEANARHKQDPRHEGRFVTTFFTGEEHPKVQKHIQKRGREFELPNLEETWRPISPPVTQKASNT
ncbi:hypothetical protein BJ165DRAFT_1597477 [Panaeolus papilionaceus]|nr:hypothetical protein BJ165DRAFT_1597477 [Panaeolus papilionaceus]